MSTCAPERSTAFGTGGSMTGMSSVVSTPV